MPCRLARTLLLTTACLLAHGTSTAWTDEVFKSAATAPSILAPLSDRYAVMTEGETPNFQRHIVPLLGRLGCNGRNCHGSFQGQGGFRLSMFGYDFEADHQALTQGSEPRVNVANSAESLILRKPVSGDEHGGGKCFESDGWEHRVLRRWIEAGARNDAHPQIKLARLEVTPAELLFLSTGDTISLRAVAHWSDGTREDVTCLCRFSTTDDGVASVDARGKAESRGTGAAYLIVYYDNGVASVPVLRPVSDVAGDNYPAVPTPTRIDELVVARLRKLGIVPSELAGDAEFLRRVSLDLAGTLPTPDEVTAFLEDSRSDKRIRKIDELLERPEYALWWTTKLCDWTGLNAAAQLGNTDFGPHVGAQWQSWIERRVQENQGYHEIVRGIVLAVSRNPGQSYDDFVAQQVSYLRTKDPVDFAAQPWMPYYWFRDNLSQPEEKALAFSYAFLGVRLDCAQCHKHPFDQWSQQDFKDFTAFFERIKKGVAPDAEADKKRLEERLEVARLNTTAIRRQTFWKWAKAGEPAPFKEIYIEPLKDGEPRSAAVLRLLGGRDIQLNSGEDPRAPLMAWLLEKDNPYFARAFVNRVWAHYLGVGIVDPPDDFNLANPPSNKPLLDWLSQEFVKRGYDMKWLHREITSSRTYQLSWKPNGANLADDRSFSRALIRRLPAEVAMDAVLQATASLRRPPKPDDLRKRFIASQPAAYERAMDYSMLVFGKPLRKTNCDCERNAEPSLLQAVFLRNDSEMRTMLHRPDGWLKQLTGRMEPGPLIRESYLRTVSREPTTKEFKRCETYFAEAGDAAEAIEDILWSLLNTEEFITNH